MRIFDRILGETWPQDGEEQAEILDELVPEEAAREYNLALLDFGSKVCTAQSPDCRSCFANEYCSYYSESMTT